MLLFSLLFYFMLCRAGKVNEIFFSRARCVLFFFTSIYFTFFLLLISHFALCRYLLRMKRKSDGKTTKSSKKILARLFQMSKLLVERYLEIFIIYCCIKICKIVILQNKKIVFEKKGFSPLGHYFFIYKFWFFGCSLSDIFLFSTEATIFFFFHFANFLRHFCEGFSMNFSTTFIAFN